MAAANHSQTCPWARVSATILVEAEQHKQPRRISMQVKSAEHSYISRPPELAIRPARLGSSFRKEDQSHAPSKRTILRHPHSSGQLNGKEELSRMLASGAPALHSRDRAINAKQLL